MIHQTSTQPSGIGESSKPCIQDYAQHISHHPAADEAAELPAKKQPCQCCLPTDNNDATSRHNTVPDSYKATYKAARGVMLSVACAALSNQKLLANAARVRAYPSTPVHPLQHCKHPTSCEALRLCNTACTPGNINATSACIPFNCGSR